MEIFDTTQSLLEQALSGSSLRQSVLANNLANANTPNYKRSDVNFGATLAQAMGGINPAASIRDTRFAPQVDTSAAERADGNNVDVATEMASLSENSLTFQTLAEVTKSRIKMLEIAMGVQR